MPLFFPAQDVQQHGADDDDTGDHRLPLLGHGEQAQAVDEHAHDEGADDRAEDRALATGERGAADHGRGYRVEFVALAQSRLGRV